MPAAVSAGMIANWKAATPKGKRYAGYYGRSGEGDPDLTQAPVYVDYAKSPEPAEMGPPAELLPPLGTMTQAVRQSGPGMASEVAGYRYAPDALRSKAEDQVTAKMGSMRKLFEPENYARQVRQTFGNLQLLEKRGAELAGAQTRDEERAFARQVKAQEANIGMGRFMLDLEGAAYQRSQRPMQEQKMANEIAGQHVGILGQIQARQLAQSQESRAAEKQTWEGQDRPMKRMAADVETAAKGAADARAEEANAREAAKFELEKKGQWTPGMPQADATGSAGGAAAGMPAAAVTPAPTSLPPIMSPADAMKLPKGSKFRTLAGEIREVNVPASQPELPIPTPASTPVPVPPAANTSAPASSPVLVPAAAMARRIKNFPTALARRMDEFPADIAQRIKESGSSRLGRRVGRDLGAFRDEWNRDDTRK